MTVATVRQAIADACATVTGLRGAAYRPDQLNPPIAVVTPGEFDPRDVMVQAEVTRPFTVSIYAGRTTEVAAQKLLDTYTDLSGSASVIAAIQASTSLHDGTTADFAEVTNVSALQVETIGAVDYLLVALTVEVAF